MKKKSTWLCLLLLASLPETAVAQSDAAASASFSTSGGLDTSSSGYLSENKPEDGLFEVSLFGGVLFPSKDHNFHDENKSHQAFRSIAPDIGLRLGYFPLTFVGAELEGAVMPTRTEDDDSAGLWAFRGHLVGQLPLYSVVPFVVAGGGRMGAGSNAMGSDGDPLFHFGLGVKAPLDDFLMLRLDVRDNLTQKNGADDGSLTHHPEIIGSLTFVLNRKRSLKPRPDRDGDGFLDDRDACPDEAGAAPDGCPVRDSDGDGFMDAQDACPSEAGVAPDGCPLRDRDGDGVTDEQDKCPDTAGVAPDGCPVDADPDKDGILGDADKCPNEPETVNQYQDDDGCPDEVPEKIKQFTGVIEGIEFDTGKATIRPASNKRLNAAYDVLAEFPSVRVEISGHTDTDGPRERNLELSKARADAVKAYLVAKGIADGRIATRGAGPDEPIADNNTWAGKQKNRRIEFKLLK